MLNRNKLVFWSLLVLIDLVIAALLLSGILLKKDYSLNQKENAWLIGESYMTMNNEFYKIISEEISAKVELEGDKIILRDPALNAKRQIEQIWEMLAMGIDVLVVAPVDWESLASVLEEAKEQGTLIVVVDTNV